MAKRWVVWGTAAVLVAASVGVAAEPSPAEALKGLYGRRDLAKVRKAAERVTVDGAAVSVAERARKFEGEEKYKAVFEFVRDQVKTEVYPGSLRGAAGTLLAMAGNPTDKALLLAVLLRETEYEVRYATADAPQALRRAIIAGMFDPKAKPLEDLVKAIPEDQAKDLAATDQDPKLLAELARHLWVQVKVDEKWIDLDPSLPGHKVGQAAVKARETLDDLPEDLGQRLTIRVALRVAKADKTEETQEVLARTVNVAECVGLPLILVHKPEKAVRGEKNVAIRPALIWRDDVTEGRPFDRRGIAEGGAMPNPFGKLLDDGAAAEPEARLLAETLEISTTIPGRGEQSIRRFLFDWREGKPDEKALAAAPRRVVGIVVLPGTVTRAAIHRSVFLASGAYRGKADAMQALAKGDAEAARVYDQEVAPALLGSLPWTLQATAETVACTADQAQAKMNERSTTRTYCDGPRVFLVTLNAETGQMRFDLGLRRQRTVTAPGRPKALGHAAQAFASVAHLSAESRMGTAFRSGRFRSAETILAEAVRQKIPFERVLPNEAAKVDRLPIPASVKALEKERLAQGCVLSVMSRPLAGAPPNYAFLAVDPGDLSLSMVLPDGSDGAFGEAVTFRLASEYMDWPTSILMAYDTYLYTFAAELIGAIDGEAVLSDIVGQAMWKAADITKQLGMNLFHGTIETLTQWYLGMSLAALFVEAEMRDATRPPH